MQILVGSPSPKPSVRAGRSRGVAADQGEDALLARTDTADAILVMGGEDIDPGPLRRDGRLRGREPSPPRGRRAQVALVRRAIERETPLLGICRGLQIINVALGGTLVQHLGETNAHKNHGVPIRDIMATHRVRLATGSLVAGLLERDTVAVQSAHHQAVDAVGSGLVVTGRAPDGHVEALEHETAPVLGVQWHPEDPGRAGGPAGRASRARSTAPPSTAAASSTVPASSTAPARTRSRRPARLVPRPGLLAHQRHE